MRDSSVLVVGLYRGPETEAQPDASKLTTAISRGSGVSRIILGPMTADEVGRLVRSVLSAEPSARMLLGIEDTAEGNSLFADELGRLADARQPDAGQPYTGQPYTGQPYTGQPYTGQPVPGTATVPAGIRDVIASRLDQLPPSTRALVRTASVLGREFSLDLLSRVADLPASDVADQLDVARARALLTGGDAGRLRFTACTCGRARSCAPVTFPSLDWLRIT